MGDQPTDPGKARTLLIVCHANVSRSIMAEAILRRMLIERGAADRFRIVSGGVAYYGTAYNNHPDSLAKINKPVMLLNGALDARIGAAMPMIDSVMKANGKTYEGHNYPNAIHGFLRAQGDSAFVRDSTAPDGRRLNTVAMEGNTAATKDAWPRTIAFLRKHLGATQQ